MKPTLPLLLITFFLISCNSNNSPGEEPGNTNVIPGTLEDTLLHLQKQEDKAETEQDFAVLDKLLSPDFRVIRLDGEVWTREQLYEDIRSSSSDYYYAPIYDSVKVATSKDTAFMNYKISFINRGTNATDTMKYDMNTIWLRNDSGWVLLRMSVGKTAN